MCCLETISRYLISTFTFVYITDGSRGGAGGPGEPLFCRLNQRAKIFFWETDPPLI